MRLSFKKINQNLIVLFDGELDHHASQEVRTEIDKEIDKNNCKNIIFDLSGMNFMDSSGIGVVIGRYKKVNKLGGEAVVVNLSDRVERIFKMSGLFNIVKHYENTNQAIERL